MSRDDWPVACTQFVGAGLKPARTEFGVEGIIRDNLLPSALGGQEGGEKGGFKIVIRYSLIVV
jgi:hypothetical protein